MMTRTDIRPADLSKLSLQEREDIVIFRFQRWRANMLCFSDLCIKSVCRRAGTCSANPDICIGHLAPFVPHEVSQGVDALLEGQIDGLTYDEVRARSPREVAAYEGWLEKISESRLDRAHARGNPKPGS
jgi:hypothetical protein